MPMPTVHFNDYVSLAVMLLMAIALVAGQSGGSAYAAEDTSSFRHIEAVDDRINIDLDGRLGNTALKVSIAVVTDLSHFRGEDE
jgi:hypothetical protein